MKQIDKLLMTAKAAAPGPVLAIIDRNDDGSYSSTVQYYRARKLAPVLYSSTHGSEAEAMAHLQENHPGEYTVLVDDF